MDLHIDWQGGWTPSALDGDASSVHRFIKPARVKWQAFTDGTTFTGFVFGSGSVLARIYNKSHQAKQKLDDAYFALLAERNPDTFDPEQDVWRLEFQLRREGIKGFKLYAEPDAPTMTPSSTPSSPPKSWSTSGACRASSLIRQRCGSI